MTMERLKINRATGRANRTKIRPVTTAVKNMPITISIVVTTFPNSVAGYRCPNPTVESVCTLKKKALANEPSSISAMQAPPIK